MGEGAPLIVTQPRPTSLAESAREIVGKLDGLYLRASTEAYRGLQLATVIPLGMLVKPQLLDGPPPTPVPPIDPIEAAKGLSGGAQGLAETGQKWNPIIMPKLEAVRDYVIQLPDKIVHSVSQTADFILNFPQHPITSLGDIIQGAIHDPLGAGVKAAVALTAGVIIKNSFFPRREIYRTAADLADVR